MLGSEAVIGIVMSMSLIELRVKMDITTTFAFLNLVRHSVATGFLSRYLLSKRPTLPDLSAVKGELMNEAFTTGLLHDFGKIVLLYNFPDSAVGFYGDKSGTITDDVAYLNAERDVFEFDHVETGGYLARHLNFPDSISQVIEYHHSYDQMEGVSIPNRHLVYTIAAANKAANSLNYGYDREMTRKACSDDPIWSYLIAEGLVPYDEPEPLIDDIFDLRETLDEYVHAIA